MQLIPFKTGIAPTTKGVVHHFLNLNLAGQTLDDIKFWSVPTCLPKVEEILTKSNKYEKAGKLYFPVILTEINSVVYPIPYKLGLYSFDVNKLDKIKAQSSATLKTKLESGDTDIKYVSQDEYEADSSMFQSGFKEIREKLTNEALDPTIIPLRIKDRKRDRRRKRRKQRGNL